jgi:hypothetical protein
MALDHAAVKGLATADGCKKVKIHDQYTHPLAL